MGAGSEERRHPDGIVAVCGSNNALSVGVGGALKAPQSDQVLEQIHDTNKALQGSRRWASRK
jgi:hypothetical protein